MQLAFEKWHGCKNDFIIVRIKANDDLLFASLQRRAAALCKRDGSGIGADGIIVLLGDSADDPLPEKLAVINQDGSLAKTCGNGIRCAALSVLFKHTEAARAPLEAVEFELASTKVTCRFLSRGKSLNREAPPLVAVDMGVPVVNDDLGWYQAALALTEKALRAQGLEKQIQEIAFAEISNQHLVLFADKASRELLHKIGPALQKTALWDGINVSVVAPGEVSDSDKTQSANALGEKISERYAAFVWERGVGETQACGSGACAIAATAFAAGGASRAAPLAIDMPGGRLYVKQTSADDAATLVGPGCLVFRGVLDY